MNILVTLDKNYLPPLKTMLLSLFINHPCDSFDVYLASDNLTEDNLGDVSNLCRRFHSASIPSAPCMKRISEILSMRRVSTRAS